MSAAPMGMPGWPLFAFCTPSAASMRMVFTAFSTRAVLGVADKDSSGRGRGGGGRKIAHRRGEIKGGRGGRTRGARMCGMPPDPVAAVVPCDRCRGARSPLRGLGPGLRDPLPGLLQPPHVRPRGGRRLAGRCCSPGSNADRDRRRGTLRAGRHAPPFVRGSGSAGCRSWPSPATFSRNSGRGARPGGAPLLAGIQLPRPPPLPGELPEIPRRWAGIDQPALPLPHRAVRARRRRGPAPGSRTDGGTPLRPRREDGAQRLAGRDGLRRDPRGRGQPCRVVPLVVVACW